MQNRAPQALTGGTALWIFMTVEVLTFALFLLVHAWGWRSEPEVYRAGQAMLHVNSAIVGTVLLLLGSGFAYQGVLAHGAGKNREPALWFAAGALAGIGFCINKIIEYSSPELAGVTLSTSSFWFSYLFVTGMHLLHVLGGIGFFGWYVVRLWRHSWSKDDSLGVEAVAAYWHLVDVIWILILPIIYVMQA